MLRKGDVLVIDRLGDHKHACIGGGVMCAIKASGCSGVIVDGTITDINELLEYDIPIWSRGLSPITTRLYNIGGALNTPVSIGGAAVLPGYCVIADDSGVLFLPPDEAQNYAQWAEDYANSFAHEMDYKLPQEVARHYANFGGSGPDLDIGAGTGLAAEALTSYGIGPIDALDISQEMLSVAVSKGVYRNLMAKDITCLLYTSDAADE